MLLIVLTIISAIAASLVAFFVLLRNSGSPVHRWLFWLILLACAWIVSITLHSVTEEFIGLWLLRVAFVLAVLMSYSMLRFVNALCSIRLGLPTHILMAILALGGSFLGLTALVTEGFSEFVQGGRVIPVRGILYPLILSVILFFIVFSLLNLGSRYRRVKGVYKAQLRIVGLGLAVGSVVGVLTNIVLPNITGTTQPSRFAFLAIIILTASLVYAVVEHRFLDVRWAVARTIAYVCTLLVVAILYVAVIYGVVQFSLSSLPPGSSLRLALEIGTTLLLAVSFRPMRAFFDRITTQLFFRDAYSTKQVLDKIGEGLVEEVKVEPLVQRTGQIVMQATKAAYFEVVIASPKSQARHIFIGQAPPGDREELLRQMQSSPQKFVSVDELQQPTPAQQALGRANLAVASRLETSKEQIGFMLLGYKATGAAYTSQDGGLLKLVAGELAVAVQNAQRFEEIMHFNETLQAEVKEATAKLRESNRTLQKLDEAKDEFISMASHQLRTPLTSVKGYLSMALEGDGGRLKPQQRRLLQEAYSSAQRMVYLIGDFLNISRLQTGRFMVERRPAQLKDIVKEEIEQLSATAARRNIRLVFHPPARFPVIEVDENKLRQVIMNFIDNAIFYSQPGTEVLLGLEAGKKEACFTVADTGIGVPKAERAKIFTKFYRASNARQVRPDGTGIGLFMSKKVIDSHGGKMVFKTKENFGSTFGFCLPLKNQPK